MVALNRNARANSDAIWARVTGTSGQKRAGEVEQPVVMPAAASASIADSWVLPPVSANPAGSAGLSRNARFRKLAIAARVTGRSGQKRAGFAPHP